MELTAEFQRRFPDEQACRIYLFRLRWPDGYSCPRCGHPHSYDIPTRQLRECRECRMQTSVTAGTIMHRTKLPLRHWFLAMFLVATGQPCSARSLVARLAINYRSALGMLRKIRRVIRSENGPHPLAHSGGGFGVWHVLRENLGSVKIHPDTSGEKETLATIRSSGRAWILTGTIKGNDAIGEIGAAGAMGEIGGTGKIGGMEKIAGASEPGTAAQTEAVCQIGTEAAPDQASLDVPVRAPAPQYRKHIPVSNNPHEIVERAKRKMLEKAATFIKRSYRNVSRSSLQGYIDEFYYRRTGYAGISRFLDLLRTSVLVLPCT